MSATIGERVKTERGKRGLTREAAALELGTSPQALRQWEIGICNPRPEKVERIEEWLSKKPAKGRNGRAP